MKRGCYRAAGVSTQSLRQALGATGHSYTRGDVLLPTAHGGYSLQLGCRPLVLEDFTSSLVVGRVMAGRTKGHGSH